MDKKHLIATAEHDYCMWQMTELAKQISKKSGDFMNDPIINMIDDACGYDGVDWREVAMLIYWANEANKRRSILSIPTDTNDFFVESLKKLMTKHGKEDFLEKVLVELEKD